MRVALALALALVVAAPASAVKRRAFVTSVSGNGNLNSWADSGGLFGVAAGDNICRVRAAAGGLPNPTAYRAWLSSAATDAYCHVQGQTGKKDTGCVGTAEPAGPWYRYDGVGRFSGTLDELTGPEQRIYQPIRYDEFGTPLYGGFDSYWTGTLRDGRVSADTCGSWVIGSAGSEGRGGVPERTSDHWTNGLLDICAVEVRLLCFEGGESEVTPVPWVPAALVFTTSATGPGDLSSWPEASFIGAAAGDAICRNLAAAAHLPSSNTFVAWISTQTTDAADRVTLDSTPFRRVDGFRLADSKSDLLANGADNTLHVDEAGRYLSSATVRTGTRGDGTASTQNCNGWHSSLANDQATRGLGNAAYGENWTEDVGVSCSAGLRLYCFSNREVLFWDGFDLSENTERWSAVAP